MVIPAVTFPGVIRASLLADPVPEGLPGERFSFESVSGRLVEIVVDRSTPVLSVLSLLIRQAQQRGFSVAWVSTGPSIFYPPDFYQNGVSIASLPVVRVGTRKSALRVAEHLLRSEAFGMVVVDLELGVSKHLVLGRLNKLAGLHQSAVIFLNHLGPHSFTTLGSLISLRISVGLEHPGPNLFICSIRALKDRRAMAGWREEVVFRGTDGLY